MKTLPFKQTIEGIVWSGLYELEPYEPEEHNFPALMPICTVISLFMNMETMDMLEIVNPSIVQQIESSLEMSAVPWSPLYGLEQALEPL